jgi:predicted RNA-binding Zn-ribbon protein involved in translation (DUF1610 family)
VRGVSVFCAFSLESNLIGSVRRIDSTTMDRHTLLCESCGYQIEDLPPEGNCPECGLAIAHSLPQRRAGSPWQQRPGLFSWARTGWLVMRHPAMLFGAIRIEPARSGRLLVINHVIAGAFLAAPWTGTLIGDPSRRARGSGFAIESAALLGMFIAQTLALTCVLLLLTWIEYRGIRFFAARRGWRLTPDAGWQICAHASYGWVLMGILPLVGMTLSFLLGAASLRGVIDLSPALPITIHVSSVVLTAMIAGGLLIGLFGFEMLVYLGVRRCKYAASLRA